MIVRVFALLICVGCAASGLLIAQETESTPQSDKQDTAAEVVRTEDIAAAMRDGKYTEAASLTKRLLAGDPSIEVKLYAADTLLRCGDAATALTLFDGYVEAKPNSEPYLWQRGIAQYFVGKYDEGAKQFEIHRKVNGNDVENAAWHFLCVAKRDSAEEAKKLLLPAPGDPRPPMSEVLEMFRTGNRKDVLARIESYADGTGSRATAEFYGWFYLGLYADALNDLPAALKYLNLSAKDAPRHYMGDVARVYVNYLKERQAKKSSADKKRAQ